MKFRDDIYLGFTAIIYALAIYYALFLAPADVEMGELVRIFYFHLPLAITSYLAFFIVFLSGILYLQKKDIEWDFVASASAEVGVLFCTLAIITGMLWAKAEWGMFWDWGDMKLNTTLVLWLIYIAYLSIRNSIEEKEKRARLSAVYGIIGFVGVPLSYFSFYIWEWIHPKVVSPGGGGLRTEMRTALIISMFAFFIFYFYLLFKRIALEKLSERIETIEEILEE